MVFFRTAFLLFFSNIVMTFAWYGHLRFFKERPLWWVVFISWGIAFFEYCLAVPANRFAHGVLSVFQLKILQEAITIAVFISFAWVIMKEPLKWNYIVSFGCVLLAVFFAFRF